jgi:hypothetical protein
MKLATITLASVLALSSTVAFAYIGHHRTDCHGYHGYYGYRRTAGMSFARTYRGAPNNRGGLVGGDDRGTYKP